MKFNKKVSDLARKLDYIGVNSERKRKLIKLCINPIHFLAGGYYIKR